MMGHREKLKDGYEWDCFSGWKKIVGPSHKITRFCKRKMNKRIRRIAKLKHVSFN
jgi:hypothetical protein